MPEQAIEVRGARVNNLKNISFSIPINQMTVVTGVSGSGKSSLAFDTIYAEGQRRYVESLSAYARQFLERMDKPDVDEVRGIAPAIAVVGTSAKELAAAAATTRCASRYSSHRGEIDCKEAPAKQRLSTLFGRSRSWSTPSAVAGPPDLKP